jgi:protocatechuate 3,4-dioxygenase beta subunit
VRVTDSQGRAVPGATVDFVLTEDGGGGQVNPSSAVTDSDGQASATIQLGSHVGQMTGEARVQVPEGVTPVTAPFSATALAADANGIVVASGDGQSGPVGSALAQPLVVQVTDGFGNPISGVTVQWSADGQGSVSEEQTVTDVNGNTSVIRTLGPNAGTQTTTASADGLVGSPVTFTSTATAGSASRIVIVSGNNQTAATGSELPESLVVQVLDQDNNPIPNSAVAWVIGVGGGSMNPETSQTNSDGVAYTHWTLGSSPGTNTVNAVVSGVGSVTFSATASGTGAPSNLAVTTQPPASVLVGAILTPGTIVQVRDGAGHDVPVAGVEITVALTGGGGQLSGTTTVVTDAAGKALFGDLRITGATGSRRLIFAAEGYRSATSDKIDVQKASTTTAITGVSPEPSNVNDPVTVSFSVTSGAGTPSGNVVVTASGGGESCSAAVAAGSCQIVLTSSGTRTLTVTYQGDDSFAGSQATAPHTVNELPNNPPSASFTHADCVAGAACQFTDTSTDPDGNQTIVAWSWDFGDFVTSTDQNPQHTYIVGAGFTYHVTLTVTDNRGASSSTAQDVTVP